jgi:hypothetical protein
MKDFQKYKRTNVAEMIKLTDYNLFTLSELLAETTVSVSAPDQELAPDVFKLGYIARNPNNHDDMWYVSKKYFDENFAPIDAPLVTADSFIGDITSLDSIGASDYAKLSDEQKQKLLEDWGKSVKPVSVAVGYDGLQSGKTLDNTSITDVKSKVSDVVVWGDGDTFRLISKASSKNQGWMKSCKAMQIDGVGCIVQVTTQQYDNVAEAVVFVPDTRIDIQRDEESVVIGRKIVHIKTTPLTFEYNENTK